MSKLTLTANIPGADDFYAELLEAHEGLTKAESDALNARLILTLANHIALAGRSIVREAVHGR